LLLIKKEINKNFSNLNSHLKELLYLFVFNIIFKIKHKNDFINYRKIIFNILFLILANEDLEEILLKEFYKKNISEKYVNNFIKIQNYNYKEDERNLIKMERIFQLLFYFKKFLLFNKINIISLYKFLNYANLISFDKNEYIFKINENINNFYLILKGSVKILDNLNNEIITLKKGDYFGENEIINKNKSKLNIITNEKTLLLFLNQEDFNNILLKIFKKEDNKKKEFIMHSIPPLKNYIHFDNIYNKIIKLIEGKNITIYKQNENAFNFYLIYEGNLKSLNNKENLIKNKEIIYYNKNDFCGLESIKNIEKIKKKDLNYNNYLSTVITNDNFNIIFKLNINLFEHNYEKIFKKFFINISLKHSQIFNDLLKKYIKYKNKYNIISKNEEKKNKLLSENIQNCIDNSFNLIEKKNSLKNKYKKKLFNKTFCNIKENSKEKIKKIKLNVNNIPIIKIKKNMINNKMNKKENFDILNNLNNYYVINKNKFYKEKFLTSRTSKLNLNNNNEKNIIKKNNKSLLHIKKRNCFNLLNNNNSFNKSDLNIFKTRNKNINENSFFKIKKSRNKILNKFYNYDNINNSLNNSKKIKKNFYFNSGKINLPLVSILNSKSSNNIHIKKIQ
jgi:CRP-like cAMP-binding protein